MIYIKFNKDGGAAAEIIDYFGKEGVDALKKVSEIQDAASELVKGKIGYRYISSDVSYLDNLKQTGIIPNNPNKTYFTLDKFDSPTEAISRSQLPFGDAKWRAEFDTSQLGTYVEFPLGKFQKKNYIEIICKSYPEYGKGGTVQFLTTSKIKLIRMEYLETGEIINFK